MKVDSSADSYIGSVAGGPAKPVAPAAAAAKPAAAGTPQAGVTVTLSAAAAAEGGEVFNAGKVEAMKQAIADGSFQVNAEVIADKMLANAAEMLGGGARRG
jgi:negative regulator of flagellin synthesis FlgM